MYLVREIMYCKPGKVRPLLEKFKAMAALSEQMGMPKMRLMTDFCADRYWTVIAEMETESLAAFEKMMSDQGTPEQQKQFGEIMKDYHDLVARGKREIFKIEM